MALGTTAALIAASVISAGAAGVSANQQKKQSQGRAGKQRELEKQKRIAQVSQQEADAQRARDARAVEQATAANIEGRQLETQGITDDFGTLDVGALGGTSRNTAASTLNPIQPNTGV